MPSPDQPQPNSEQKKDAIINLLRGISTSFVNPEHTLGQSLLSAKQMRIWAGHTGFLNIDNLPPYDAKIFEPWFKPSPALLPIWYLRMYHPQITEGLDIQFYLMTPETHPSFLYASWSGPVINGKAHSLHLALEELDLKYLPLDNTFGAHAVIGNISRYEFRLGSTQALSNTDLSQVPPSQSGIQIHEVTLDRQELITLTLTTPNPNRMIQLTMPTTLKKFNQDRIADLSPHSPNVPPRVIFPTSPQPSLI